MLDLLWQPAISGRVDFREERVTFKLLQDLCDKQSGGSCPLHQLLGSPKSQIIHFPEACEVLERWTPPHSTFRREKRQSWGVPAVPGRASCLRSPTPGRPARPAPCPPAGEPRASPGQDGELLPGALWRRHPEHSAGSFECELTIHLQTPELNPPQPLKNTDSILKTFRINNKQVWSTQEEDCPWEL